MSQFCRKLLGKNKISKEKGKTMSQKIYVGFDFAKNSSRIVAVDEEGNKASSTSSITNTREGMEKLLLKLSSYKKDQVLCGMEASSNYLRKYMLLPEAKRHILSFA